MAVSPSARQQLVRDNRTHDKDTGSPEVQVALLTEEIKALTEHLRQHPKDFSSRRGLLFMVNRRNKLLKYLQRVDAKRYAAVVAKFELRR
jgi:small subunit ribosomal protein S15